MNPIHQSSRKMRVIGILLALPISALNLWAQTNASNYAAPVPEAQTGTNASAEAVLNPSGREVRQLSLQDCIQLTLQHDLNLQIERYNPQLAMYTLGGAYGVYDPVLDLSGQHDHSKTGSRLLSGGLSVPGSQSDDNSFSGGLGGYLPLGTTYSLQANAADTYGNSVSSVNTNGLPIESVFENTAASASANLTQPLLRNFWIDNNRLVIRVAKNRLKYSELGLKWQIIQTVTQLEQAYYDLIYSRENVLVQQKAVELADRLVSENKKRLEVGALAPLDLESAESQAAQSRAAVFAAQSQLGTQERVVKQFITDHFKDWADLTLEPEGKLTATHRVFDRQDSWGKGLSQRPDLLQSKLDVERAGIQLKYYRNQLFPELDLFGTYGYNGSGKEFSGALYDVQQQNRPFYTYGARLSVPLANLTARNNYKSGKATLQQVLLSLKSLEQTIMISIDNDIGTIQANYEQVLATRAARQYAEAALNAEEMKLQNGKSTVYTVLQMQRDLTTARGNEILALDSYNKSLATLSQDEGGTLERLGIDWQAK
jgi:outer membrane protein